ncbi:hypothetical protein DFH09DRAFT_1091847 [Mycena vulgaris]|nr:hypothetical protein DFH09DRAFT_1091847 [Mycena vulgaris]
MDATSRRSLERLERQLAVFQEKRLAEIDRKARAEAKQRREEFSASTPHVTATTLTQDIKMTPAPEFHDPIKQSTPKNADKGKKQDAAEGPGLNAQGHTFRGRRPGLRRVPQFPLPFGR